MADITFKGKTIEQVLLPTGTTISGSKATLAVPVSLDASATLALGAGGITFPAADPLIAGAWWDNAGTLTKSAGA